MNSTSAFSSALLQTTQHHLMHALKSKVFSTLPCSLHAAAAAKVQVAELLFDGSVLSNSSPGLLSTYCLLSFMLHKLLFSLQLQFAHPWTAIKFSSFTFDIAPLSCLCFKSKIWAGTDISVFFQEWYQLEVGKYIIPAALQCSATMITKLQMLNFLKWCTLVLDV